MAKPAAPKQSLRPPKARSPKPLVVAAPAPVISSSGGTSAAVWIIALGVLLALLTVGLSFTPAKAVPFTVGLRLERNRQTIMLMGLAIGVACVLVALLTVLAGR